jgi:hypothetical protein
MLPCLESTYILKPLKSVSSKRCTPYSNLQGAETIPFTQPSGSSRDKTLSQPSGSGDILLFPTFWQERHTLSSTLRVAVTHLFSHTSGSRGTPFSHLLVGETHLFSHTSGRRDTPLLPPFRQKRHTSSPNLLAVKIHPFSHPSGSRATPLLPTFWP